MSFEHLVIFHGLDTDQIDIRLIDIALACLLWIDQTTALIVEFCNERIFSFLNYPVSNCQRKGMA